MDYNATTPAREEILEILDQTVRESYANPSSSHLPGRRAKAVMDEAREKTAEKLDVRPSEIFFTSGGSESNNLAIKGTAWKRQSGHIISSEIEHPAVMEPCRFLESRGFSVTYVPVDASGRVDPNAVAEAIREDTILITIMWANNETGVIQPVEEISRIARMRGILFHTDAVQAFGKVPVDVVDNPIDMLSISGHKLYGPRGVGVLYVRRAVRLEALVHGGGQERGVRGGTENLPGIAAMAEACRLAAEERDREAQRIASLRDSLEERILNRIPGTSINGNRSARIPNTSNITFRGAEGEAVIFNLDEFGIAASSASACAASHTEPSRVLLAMGLSKEEADASVRFSLGRWSEVSHVERLLDVLPGIIERLRSLTSESKPGDRANAG